MPVIKVGNKKVRVDEVFEIKWSEKKLDSLRNYEDDAREVLYAFVRKYRYGGKYRREVLYIGIARKQDFRNRFRNHHKLPDIEAYVENRRGELVVKIGRVILEEGKRLTQKKVEEIENLLIYVMEPKFNDRKTKSYGGRDILIENSGIYKPLPKYVLVLDDEIRVYWS